MSIARRQALPISDTDLQTLIRRLPSSRLAPLGSELYAPVSMEFVALPAPAPPDTSNERAALADAQQEQAAAAAELDAAERRLLQAVSHHRRREQSRMQAEVLRLRRVVAQAALDVRRCELALVEAQQPGPATVHTAVLRRWEEFSAINNALLSRLQSAVHPERPMVDYQLSVARHNLNRAQVELDAACGDATALEFLEMA